MGGTDDPNNLINLTVEQHAEAHKKLYEKYGCWQDLVAYNALSGQINSEEARRIAVSKTLKGKPKTKEHKKKLQENLKKNGFNTNPIFTQSHKKKISENAKNRPIVECPHCGKTGQSNAMQRWHFDRCSYK